VKRIRDRWRHFTIRSDTQRIGLPNVQPQLGVQRIAQVQIFAPAAAFVFPCLFEPAAVESDTRYVARYAVYANASARFTVFLI
jgi:hypothetical protein